MKPRGTSRALPAARPAPRTREGALQGWHPAWKLPALLLLVLAIIATGSRGRFAPDLTREIPVAALALALGLSTVAASGLSWRVAARFVRPALWILLLFGLTLPFSRPLVERWPGEVVTISGLALAPRGLLVAALITARTTSCLLLVLGFAGTTSAQETLAALRALHVPAGLVRMAALAHRHVASLAGEATRRRTAWRARGFRPAFSRHGLETVGNGVGMLVLGALDRARRTDAAIAARGGSNRAYPVLTPRSTSPSDVGLMLLAALVCVALVASSWWGGSPP